MKKFIQVFDVDYNTDIALVDENEANNIMAAAVKRGIKFKAINNNPNNQLLLFGTSNNPDLNVKYKDFIEDIKNNTVINTIDLTLPNNTKFDKLDDYYIYLLKDNYIHKQETENYTITTIITFKDSEIEETKLD